jgi:hypothetical protein
MSASLNARKFDFINVEWDWKPLINEEIEALKSKGISQPHRLLSMPRYDRRAESRHAGNDSRPVAGGVARARHPSQVHPLSEKRWRSRTHWSKFTA